MTAGTKAIHVLNPQILDMVHEVAGENITGFDGNVESIRAYNDRLKQNLDRLFSGVGEQPPGASTVLALMDSDESEMFGAAIVETPYFDELAKEDEELARVMATSHRVLAGMFVFEEYRGQGMGRELLDWTVKHTLIEQARYLDGFVDERSGSADFYRQSGAVVTGRNQGLPARSPVNIPQTHVKEVNGHWFYVDGWSRFGELMDCARCGGQLHFVAEDGGRLACDSCGG